MTPATVFAPSAALEKSPRVNLCTRNTLIAVDIPDSCATIQQPSRSMTVNSCGGRYDWEDLEILWVGVEE